MYVSCVTVCCRHGLYIFLWGLCVCPPVCYVPQCVCSCVLRVCRGPCVCVSLCALCVVQPCVCARVTCGVFEELNPLVGCLLPRGHGGPLHTALTARSHHPTPQAHCPQASLAAPQNPTPFSITHCPRPPSLLPGALHSPIGLHGGSSPRPAGPPDLAVPAWPGWDAFTPHTRAGASLSPFSPLMPCCPQLTAPRGRVLFGSLASLRLSE